LNPAKSIDRARDHLANERTFLAWVRTGIGVIVFGFAIARFGLALRQLSGLRGVQTPDTGSSLWFGCAAIFLGIFLIAAAWVRFQRVRTRLENDQFESSGIMILLVSLATTAFGIALIVYLILTEYGMLRSI
jgi:uncharacterized membrane protein YidH (DUF202 family)